MKNTLPYIGLSLANAAIIIKTALSANSPDALTLLRYALLVTFSYLAAITDLKTKTIPNRLILHMLAAWLIVISIHVFWDISSIISVLMSSVFGLIVGGGMFLLVYMVSNKGLGGGDVKFISVAGLFLGFDKTIQAILYGTTIAALISLVLIWQKRINRKDTVPLAPFLFIGVVITLLLQ